jgi:hypothetical protein
MGRYGLDPSGSGLRQIAGSYEHGDKPSGSWEILWVAERLLASKEWLGSIELVS